MVLEGIMETGKLPNDILEKIVLNKIHNSRDDIILRPGIGEDCSAVEFGEYA
jgi:hydrogenase maturation factor